MKVWEINRARYPGKIDEGSLARIETTKLEAESQVDMAAQAVKLAIMDAAFAETFAPTAGR